jgi:putative peptidoglycan lipid II flippase
MSASRTLARAGLIVSGAFLVSRVLGWARLVVIANTLPPDTTTDLGAFFAAFRIPDLMFQLVAAGALSSALIPVVSSVMTTDGEGRAWRVVSTVINLMLIALAVLGVIVLIGADTIVPAFTGGFDQPTMDRTIELTRIMVLSPIFLALGSVATSVLNARGRFAAAALAPSIYNLAIIGAAFTLAPTMGAAGLAIGVVLGSLGHILVQLRPLRAIGFHYQPIIDLADDAARRALTLMAPRAIGLGAGQITFLVMTGLAAGIGADRGVTAFTIAFTLLQIPVGVIGVPLAVVLFPSMSREVASGNHSAFVALITRGLRFLTFVMLPIAVLGAILRVEGSAVLFGRFDSATIELIAATLLAFLVGLVAHALITVLARAFYALHDTRTPVAVAILAVAINTTVGTALAGPLGLPGLALAIALAAWLEATVLTVLLRRRVGRFGFAAVAWLGLRTIVATAIAAVVAQVVHGSVGPALVLDPSSGGFGNLPGLVAVLVSVGAVYAAVFVVAALALRIEELRSIVEIMVDALRRPRRS